MFTQRAFLLGVVAFCFYLIAVVNTLPAFYYLLTWLALGLLAAALGIAFLSLAGLSCAPSLRQSSGFARWPQNEEDDEEGDALAPQLQLDLKNSGTLNKTGILLEFFCEKIDDENAEASLSQKKYPSWIQSLADLRAARKARRRLRVVRFLIEALPSGVAQTATLPLGTLGRGHYRIQRVRLVASDVLGLFRVSKRIAWPDELNRDIVVGPPMLSQAWNQELQNYGGGGSGMRPLRHLGTGDELRGARPYAVGDDWRHIHWPTTARIGQLVVREFERTERAAACVVWDGALGSEWGPASTSTTELGLSLTVSVLSAMIEASVPATLAICDANAQQFSTQVHGNKEVPSLIVEALASAKANRTESLRDALTHHQINSSDNYGQLLLVTASLRSDVLDVVRYWRSYGSSVGVVLLDGAAWHQGAEEARKRASLKRRPTPTQEDGGHTITVKSEAYATLEAELGTEGVTVIRLSPSLETLALDPHKLRLALEETLTRIVVA